MSAHEHRQSGQRKRHNDLIGMVRRRAATGAMVVGCVMALSACGVVGSDDAPTGTPSPADTSTPIVTATPTATATETATQEPAPPSGVTAVPLVNTPEATPTPPLYRKGLTPVIPTLTATTRPPVPPPAPQ